DRIAGLEHPDWLQRPDFTWARRFLRHRRLYDRNSAGTNRDTVLGRHPDLRCCLSRCRVPVRVAGLTALRPLPGTFDVCPGRGVPAVIEVPSARAVDGRCPGNLRLALFGPVRAATRVGPMALSGRADVRDRSVRAGTQSAAR